MPTPAADRRRAGGRKLRIALLLLVAVAVVAALAWRYTPLQAFADPETLAARLGAVRHSPWAPLAVVLAYIALNSIMFPNTVLNLATILGLGTLPGLPYALTGSIAAAAAGYLIGRRFGKRPLKRLDVKLIERISAELKGSGILKIAVLRLLPVAPFTVVNLSAGAAGVRLLPFSIGTLLGLLPGTLLVTAFGHQLRAAINDPSPTDIALTVAIIVVAGAAAFGLRALSRRQTATA